MKDLRVHRSPLAFALRFLGILVSLSALNATIAQQMEAVDERTDVDVAKTNLGGRVVYVSSGPRPGSFHAIDNDLRTRFLFADTDIHPLIVLRLPETAPVHGVGVVPGSQGGKVDIYLMDKLARDPADLEYARPIGSIANLTVGRQAAIAFAQTNARFVALRWTRATVQSGPLQVAEIRVFVQGNLAPAVVALPASAHPPITLVSGPPVVAPVSPE